jgi:hypothetical protein
MHIIWLFFFPLLLDLSFGHILAAVLKSSGEYYFVGPGLKLGEAKVQIFCNATNPCWFRFCGLMPACYRGPLGSILWQSMWDLWWTKQHWGGSSPLTSVLNPTNAPCSSVTEPEMCIRPAQRACYYSLGWSHSKDIMTADARTSESVISIGIIMSVSANICV